VETPDYQQTQSPGSELIVFPVSGPAQKTIGSLFY
jgi:hypothetical protein